jgi:hypothetical protein
MTNKPRRPPKGHASLPASPGPAQPDQDMSPAQVAHYIAEFTAELSSIARRSDLELLAYLLDMARFEAMRVRFGDGP